MSKSLSYEWIILFGVLFYSLHCYVPDKQFSKLPKVERIASSASQEWLYTKDPTKQSIHRTVLDYADYDVDDSFYWESKSLSNKGGRVRDILYVEQDSNVLIFAASASGGLFKSNSADIESYSWNKTSLPESNISALEYDSHNNYIYAGTGEGYYEHKSFPGSGVYRSENKGDSWILLPNTTHLQYIQDIKVIGDNLFISTLNHGLLISEDHGETFETLLDEAAIGSHASVNDILEMNNGKVLTSTGLQNEGGLFRSDNTGNYTLSHF